MALRLRWLVAVLISVAISFAAGPVFSADSSSTGIKFQRQEIEFSYKNKKKKLTLDAALTGEQHAQGLMNRPKMGENEGMIFIFPDSRIREFWMKNTLIDLDIAYISSEKKIIDIQTMKAVTSVMQTNIPTYPSKGPAQYAVEMNAGWFKKNGFPVGTVLKLISGPTSKH